MRVRFQNGPAEGQETEVEEPPHVLQWVVEAPRSVSLRRLEGSEPPSDIQNCPSYVVVEYRRAGVVDGVAQYRTIEWLPVPPLPPWVRDSIDYAECERRIAEAELRRRPPGGWHWGDLEGMTARLTARLDSEDARRARFEALYSQTWVVDRGPGEDYEETSEGTSVSSAIREVWQPRLRQLLQRPFPGDEFEDERTSPDSMTIRFDKISEEAQAEMDAWMGILHEEEK